MSNCNCGNKTHNENIINEKDKKDKKDKKEEKEKDKKDKKEEKEKDRNDKKDKKDRNEKDEKEKEKEKDKDINEKYTKTLDKLYKIISKYDDYTTIDTFSDIDIKKNEPNSEYEYGNLSTLIYGPILRIFAIVEETPTGPILLNKDQFSFDKILGNIKINSNDYEYKTYIIYGFKYKKEFLFKNTMTNIMNKPL